MASLQFSHVAISCKDPIAVERFYTRHFGFRRARVIPLGEEQIVFLRSGNVYLELFQAKGEAPVPPADRDGPAYPGWRHIAFQVDDVDAKLKEMGGEAKISRAPLDLNDLSPGWRTIWLKDPEGNVV